MPQDPTTSQLPDWDLYRALREQWTHEDNLVNRRLMWLILSEGVLDKRVSKSKQRGGLVSAHLLLQVRVRVVDGMLRDDFARWYGDIPSNTAASTQVA